MNLHVSVFDDARPLDVTHCGNGVPLPKGSVLTARFVLQGHAFLILNGGPHFKPSPAVSFVVHCETQQARDKSWHQLTSGGGEPGRCGWLTDRLGVSWQIVPSVLPKLMTDPDPSRVRRMMGALMQMDKLEIALEIALLEACPRRQLIGPWVVRHLCPPRATAGGRSCQDPGEGDAK